MIKLYAEQESGHKKYVYIDPPKNKAFYIKSKIGHETSFNPSKNYIFWSRL